MVEIIDLTIQRTLTFLLIRSLITTYFLLLKTRPIISSPNEEKIEKH